MGRKSKYTKELLEPIIKDNISMAGVLRDLGLSYSGGNYSYIAGKIKEHGISTKHFKGQASNKGRKFFGTRRKPESYLKTWDRDKKIPTHRIKKWMIRDNIKEEKCERCGRTNWEGHSIPLSLHHVDGNRWNNNLDNLQILCYNCHGLTDNYSGNSNKGV